MDSVIDRIINEAAREHFRDTEGDTEKYRGVPE